jgi:hypothetical protein
MWTELPVGTVLVALVADFFRDIQHDCDRQNVKLAGQLDERFA